MKVNQLMNRRLSPGEVWLQIFIFRMEIFVHAAFTSS